jgi:hypothetical protein
VSAVAARPGRGAWSSIIGDNAELAHGYTMGDVDRITRHCVNARPMPTLDMEERWASAYHGVVEALYAWAYREPPTYKDLLDAGIAAMRVELRSERRHRGSNQRHPEDGTAPMFVRYWTPLPDRDFVDRLIEPLALAQILGALSPDLYQAVAAVAAYGSHKEAAFALGISGAALTRRLGAARREFIDLWMEPDSPGVVSSDPEFACRSGHSREQYGRVTPAGNRWCLLCVRAKKRRQRAKAR